MQDHFQKWDMQGIVKVTLFSERSTMDFKNFIQDNFYPEEMLQSIYLKEGAARTSYMSAGNLAPKPGEINAYMSMNPIGYHAGSLKRDTKHVKRLKWLYIDLDTYKTLYTKNQVYMNLEDNYFGRSIPTPTYVIDSGRGLYLLWRIDEHVKAASRWEKVQKYLFETLKEFGADRSVVTDRARVLRQIGSVNAASGSEVRVIQHWSQNMYTLYEIIEEFLPTTTVPAASKEYKKEGKKARIYTINSVNTMLTARLYDLETLLLQHRDADHSKRENILFLYRYWCLCLTGDKADSLNRIQALNQKMKHPLQEREVIRATKSAEKYFDAGQSFRMRNDTLMDFLDITEEEQESLRTIVSKKKKAARKKTRNRKAYLERLADQGKNTKEAQIKARHKAIQELLRKGKGPKEVCQELNISRATFYSDKKVIECSLGTNDIRPDNQYLEIPTKDREDIAGNDCLENSALVLKDKVLSVSSTGMSVEGRVLEQYVSGNSLCQNVILLSYFDSC